MRTILLLPLTALIAIVAGCGSETGKQTAASVPERDLTLVTQTAEVKIASPMETQQPQRAARLPRARRSSRPQPKVVLAAVAAPLAALEAGLAPVLTAAEPVAQRAGTAATPNNDRELLPGKTITVIPASTGSSSGPDEAEDLPPARGRTTVGWGGGRCRGRGRGPDIGIATAPRPAFR